MQAQPRRRRPFRTLLLAGAGLLILGIAVAVVAANALNPERLRQDLQEAVLRQTGRELTVKGGVHLQPGLSPQLIVDDIALANVAGGSRPDMLHASSIHARLALLPLLGGDAVVSALTIEQPDLLLERGPDGTPNWQFSQEHHALYQTHGMQGGGGGGGGGHVEIQALTLQGGQVTWRPTTGEPVTIGIDHLRLTTQGEDSPMKLAMDGHKGATPFTLSAASGSLQRLQGGPVSALAGAWPLTIDAASQGATLHLEGGIAHPDQARGYQMRASFTAPSLYPLRGLLDQPTLPKLADVTAAALLADGSQGELRTSQVSVHAGASDLSDLVPGLSIKQASLTAPGPGQIVQFTMDGTYQTQPLRAAATALQPDVVGTSGPIQMTLSAEAAGATLAAHGTMPPSLTTTGLDMAVTLRAPDLAALSPLAGRTLPPAQNLALDAQLNDAGVKLRGVAIRNLTATSSLGDASGELTLIWSPRLTIDGTLASRTLNLDALAPGLLPNTLPSIWPPPAASAQTPLAPATATQSAAGTVPPAPSGPLPLARLRTTDIDLNLTAADMVLGEKHYTDLQAHLQLNDGKLALNPFRAEAPEGAIIGGISLDASSDQPPIAVTLRSPSIAAEAVAAALGYPNGATGTMQVDAQLNGTGQTVQDIQSTLGGHLGLAMVNGQVDDALVQGLLGEALNTAGVPAFGGGTSQVRCLALRVDFAHGQGTIRALSADTNRLALDGDGHLNLAAATADLHLRPRLRLGPTELAAPVSLRGPFGAMHAALDPTLSGRYGISIGGAPQAANCASKLALARGGLGGPIPAQAAAPPGDPNQIIIRKPKDLLQGLFH